MSRYTNERVDALLAPHGGRRVGDIEREKGGSYRCFVNVQWDDCPHGEQRVRCENLGGKTTGCGRCAVEMSRITNADVDALLVERGLKCIRFGDVRRESYGTKNERKAKVLILWDDCPHGLRDVWWSDLNNGYTTRCRPCEVTERRLRVAEATLARALKEHHKGYTTRLTDPRPYGTKGLKQRWVAYVCPAGHEGEMALGNFARGRGCPTCADWGIDYNAPGYLYVITGSRWVKVGICNDHRLKGRLVEHAGQGLTDVRHTTHFDVTHDARALEQLWLEKRDTLPTTQLPTKADIKNGFTEAAPAHPEILQWIDTQLIPMAG